MLDDAEAQAVPAGDTSVELLSPATNHSYESDLLPILPSSYGTSAKQVTKFPVVSTDEPQFASIADCYAFFSSSAPGASIVERSCPPDSAAPAELRSSNTTFYPISTPVKKKMSPMIEHLKEKISIFGLPCAVGGADAGNAGDVYEGVDSEYECPVPDACSISLQDVAAGRPDPEQAVGVYHNFSHTSNQNSLSAASCADGSSLKPSVAVQRDPFLDFVSSVGEPEAKISIELQTLSMSMNERESIRMAYEDRKNGTFPDLVDYESEPEDEHEHRDAERRKMARKHGPRRPPPAPESYLIDYPPVVPKTGRSTGKLPTCAEDDRLGDQNNHQEAIEQTPLSKPSSSASRGGSTRRARWKSRKTRSRMDRATGCLERRNDHSRSRVAKDFEDLTVGELKSIVETCTKTISPQTSDGEFSNFSRELPDIEDNSWMDGAYLLDDAEEEQDKPSGELLNLSWRSDIEDFGGRKFVRVESVVDSGASTPVAPPSMMPGVKVVPSEGSRRGQKWSSASKHKIRNLGEQRLKAVTEEGEETEVLFQIADVSKPLVSVSAICERGNRVIFGRSGGVVQNLTTGNLIPFERRSGIYILSLWLEDDSSSAFHRP